MRGDTRRAIRELLALRLRATATQNLQIAAALADGTQDTLRRHFQSSAELMLEAAKEITGG